MALRDNVPEILEYIKDNKPTIKINTELFEIYEGALLRYVKRALAEQLDRQPFKEAFERVPGINILRKLVQKLSTIYSGEVMRRMDDETDQQLVDWYTSQMKLDAYGADANTFFNLFKYAAWEPYVEDGEPRIRAIPAHQFLVWSDDRNDPTKPTVFIKFMGHEDPFDPKSKQIYWLYTDDEFLAIDNQGSIVLDDMKDNPEGINPYGKIPFVYINKSRYKLVPNPDTDLHSMSILVPILMADLNFAAKYQTFSIVYGIDLDVDNLKFNPNALWNFQSNPQGIKPEVGTIKPSADLKDMLDSIQTQLGMWFESRNLRASTIGTLQPDNASSGIALMIQNLDTSDDRKMQVRYFEEAEKKLWKLLINYMHPVWVDSGMIEDRRLFSDDRVMVKFPEQKMLKTDQERIQNVIMKLNEGLASKRLALRELYPQLDEDELQELMQEIDDDQAVRVPVIPQIIPQNVTSDEKEDEDGRAAEV